MTAVPPSPELTDLLSRVRTRIRNALTLRGVGYVTCAVAALMVVSFVLDLTLDLPRAVRAVHLAMVAVLLAILVRRVLLTPLRIPVSDVDLAQVVEHARPEFRDRLVSALDFERRLADPAEPESRELMQHVVHEARSLARSVAVESLVDPRPARRASFAGAAGIVALVCAAVIGGSDFGLWLRRGLLLSDVDWPRRTDVRVLDFPTDGVKVVTRGDDVRIVAEVDGVVPREVTLFYEELADTPDGGLGDTVYSDRRAMYPVEGESNRFALELRSVAASFRFWVRGGDDLDSKPLFTVRAVIPPRISSISARIEYPAYSGLQPEVRDLPSLSVLESAKVRYTLVANMPLSGAQLIPLPLGEDAPPPELKDTEVTVEGEHHDTVQIELTVRESMRFHIALTSVEGHGNRAEDDVFQLIATKDRAPRIQVFYPDARKFRTPQGLLPIKAKVTDDFGCASVSLEVRRNDGAAFVVPVWPLPEEPASDGRSIDVYVPIDLTALPAEGEDPIKPTDLLHMTLRASDTTGQTEETQELVVEVIAPEAQEKRLAEEHGRLRASLLRLHQTHVRNRDAIVALRDDMAGSAVDDKARERARNAQVDQGRITNELVQFERGMFRVLDSYTLNRLSTKPTLDRLLPIYTSFLSRPVTSGDGVFPPELYDQLLAEKRAERLFDPEIVGAVLDIMDLTDVAVRELSPSVYNALQTWVTDAEPEQQQIELAASRADELDRMLSRIEERMQRWEDLNEIIATLREMAEIQDSLSKQVEVTAPGDENR